MPTDLDTHGALGGDGLHVLAMAIRDGSLREEDRSCDFICSTDTIDSYDESVEQDWELDRYLSNPVVLFAHKSRELPIGKAKNVKVVDGKLQCTIVFASEKANPEAEKVLNCVREQVLRAVSVGFKPGDYRFEKRDGREVLVWSKNELREISVTPIPANPEALAKMRAKALEDHAAKTKAAPCGEETGTMTEAEAQALRSSLAEKDATIKLHERDVADAKAKAATLEVQNKALEEKVAVLTESVKKSGESLDLATKRADDAEAAIIDHRLKSAFGETVDPAESDHLKKLAKVSPELFDAEMKRRSASPKNLTKQVLKGAAPGEGNPTADTALEAHEALARHMEGN